MTLCPLGVSEAPPINFHQVTASVWTRTTATDANMDGGKPTKPRSYTKNYRHLRNAESSWDTHTPKYISKTCLVCVMFLAFMFPELTIGIGFFPQKLLLPLTLRDPNHI